MVPWLLAATITLLFAFQQTAETNSLTSSSSQTKSKSKLENEKTLRSRSRNDRTASNLNWNRCFESPCRQRLQIKFILIMMWIVNPPCSKRIIHCSLTHTWHSPHRWQGQQSFSRSHGPWTTFEKIKTFIAAGILCWNTILGFCLHLTEWKWKDLNEISDSEVGLAPGTVSLVDAPQLELAVCRGRDDVRAVQELHVGHSLAVALQENNIYRAFSKKIWKREEPWRHLEVAWLTAGRSSGHSGRHFQTPSGSRSWGGGMLKKFFLHILTILFRQTLTLD